MVFRIFQDFSALLRKELVRNFDSLSALLRSFWFSAGLLGVLRSWKQFFKLLITEKETEIFLRSYLCVITVSYIVPSKLTNPETDDVK